MDKLIEDYDALLFDAMGVLVHREGPFPDAPELIDALNKRGKPYYVLTNDASKLPTTLAERFKGFGLDIDADRIITSGGLLEAYFQEHQLAGARCAVLGPPDSVQYVVDAGGCAVDPDGDFDVLVIGDEAGYPFIETVDAVLTSIFKKADRGGPLHLVVPNPDLIYPKSDESYGFTAGTIAAMFESALRHRYPRGPEWRFDRLGKPHAPIFDAALAKSGARRMVMIGDSIETDIRGANAFGIDSALVATGVTRTAPADLPEAIRPTYILTSLSIGS
jgi:HAD superfamily hydrolase (TIGR01450 family)